MPISSSPSSFSARRTASAAWPCGEREAELLVLVCGGDELVGVRLDADRHPDLHRLADAQFVGDVRDADDLLEGVEHDPPDARLDGPADLGGGLVVAVEGDPGGRHPGVQRGGQLAAGADIEVEPLLVQPADDGAGKERLARVEDVGVGTEGVTPGAAAGPEVGLVQEEGGVPNSSARRVTGRPPTVSTPSSSRRTVRAQTLGSRALRSSAGAL